MHTRSQTLGEQIEGSSGFNFGAGKGAEVSVSVGMTKTHTPGVQSFQVSYNVAETYSNGIRNKVQVIPDTNRSDSKFQAGKNIFYKDVQVHGHVYYVNTYLDIN